MDFGDTQDLACLLARQSLEIPQRYDLPSPFRQLFSGGQHEGGATASGNSRSSMSLHGSRGFAQLPYS